MIDFDSPRIALVHDWLTGMRGGEKVLEQLCELFPEATLFTLHHELDSISEIIKRHPIHHSFIQNLPFKKQFYRYYLPLFPWAVKQWDFKDYDLVLSISHCAVKNIAVPRHVLHISYCLSPMRYLWTLREDYLGNRPFLKQLSAIPAGMLKRWDFKNTHSVDQLIGISKTIQKRISDCYQREASLVYPPCEILFQPQPDKKDYFLVLSALVPYKKIDLAVQAFNQSGQTLVIAGDGPELPRLKKIAGNNIHFRGWVSESEKRELLRDARALLFPGFEDFGIVPLEAMAYATPVLAFAKGGVVETVSQGTTGLFFQDQTASSINQVLQEFANTEFSLRAFKETLDRFSNSRFRSEMAQEIKSAFEKHQSRNI